MTNSINPQWKRLMAGCLLYAMATTTQAQTTPPMEYGKYVEKAGSIQPLGENPFGEQINLYDGSASFMQTDILLEGIGPPISVTRSFQITQQNENVEHVGPGFLDWHLEIPRIKTVVANHISGYYHSVDGWVVTPLWRGSDAFKRCTWFRQPPTLGYEGDAFAKQWEPDEWWSGYSLIGLDGQAQKLLQSGDDPNTPTGYGMTFPLTTKARWKIGCLTNTANGEPGEAFLAVSPDGTRYWFNHLIYSQGMPLVRDDGRPLERSNAAMFVTRIEDRFGNFLTYTYQGWKLVNITASDGRQVTFFYNASGVIETITSQGSQPRTWTYQYSNGPLSAVVNPDGSKWRFNLTGLSYIPPLEPYGATCDAAGSTGANTASGSITTPSELTGTFSFAAKKHGRSYVWRQCWGAEPDGAGGWTESYAYFPRTWHSYSLIQRSISGPGVSTSNWIYTYSPSNESWEQDCAQTQCPTTVWTDVTEPDGDRERHIFSNRYGPTETLELKTELYPNNSTTPKQVVTNTYAVNEGTSPWPFPWLEFLGSTLLSRDNPYPSTTLAPLAKRQIDQDGKSFIWQVAANCGGYALCYDQFARPTKVVKSSAP